VKFPGIVNVKRMLVNASVLVCPGSTYFAMLGHVISMHVGRTRDGRNHSIRVFCNDLPTFIIFSPRFITPRTFEMA
jgi:hypothetical protein